MCQKNPAVKNKTGSLRNVRSKNGAESLQSSVSGAAGHGHTHKN